MGKKNKKEDSFNTPFKGLQLPARPAAPPPARPRPEPTPEPEVSASDAELFTRAMGGVKRLDEEHPTRVEPAKRLEPELPDDEALALAELQSLVAGEGEFRIVDSEESLSGAAPGVSFELMERLREGGFAFRRHLDLHGHTRDAAKAALTTFVTEARRDGERCVLVITGRGRSSPGGVSVLRETMPRWLTRAPLRAHVLAFCTARNVDGGPGAFYVLLRRAGVRPFGTGPA